MGALQKLKVLYSRRASPSGFFSCSAPVACPVVLPTLLSLILQVDVSDRPRPSSSDRSSSGMGILQKRKELYWLLTGSLITSQKETTYQSSWYCHLFAAHGLSLLRNFTSPFASVHNPGSLGQASGIFLCYHFLPFPNSSPSWNDLFTAYCLGLVFKAFQNLAPFFLAVVRSLLQLCLFLS